MSDPAELSCTITKGDGSLTWYLRISDYAWTIAKSAVVSPVKSDTITGKPSRLGLDFGGTADSVLLYGKIKKSDLDPTYEPDQNDLTEAVRTWWADGANAGWTSNFVILSIDGIQLEGILSDIRIDRDSGQDDWITYQLRFYAKERLNENIRVK